jgi:hypothetical protein
MLRKQKDEYFTETLTENLVVHQILHDEGLKTKKGG